ncbi:MAG: hypothetical protein ACK5XN_09615 [Bacteroidota bacterium]
MAEENIDINVNLGVDQEAKNVVKDLDKLLGGKSTSIGQRAERFYTPGRFQGPVGHTASNFVGPKLPQTPFTKEELERIFPRFRPDVPVPSIRAAEPFGIRKYPKAFDRNESVQIGLTPDAESILKVVRSSAGMSATPPLSRIAPGSQTQEQFLPRISPKPDIVEQAATRSRSDVEFMLSQAPKDESVGQSDSALKEALARQYAIRKEAHEKELELVVEIGQKRIDLATKFVQVGQEMAAVDPSSQRYQELAGELENVGYQLDEVGKHDQRIARQRAASADEGVRLAKKEAAETSRIARQRDRDFDRITSSHLRSLREQEQARQRDERSFEQHSHRIGGLLSQVTESTMRVARGFTMLGLVGEDDLQKVQDSLLQVQAAFDIFTGATRGILAIEQAIESVNTITRLATQSQVAYNAAMQAGAAIQAAGSLLGGGASGGGSSGGGGSPGRRRYALRKSTGSALGGVAGAVLRGAELRLAEPMAPIDLYGLDMPSLAQPVGPIDLAGGVKGPRVGKRYAIRKSYGRAAAEASYMRGVAGSVLSGAADGDLSGGVTDALVDTATEYGADRLTAARPIIGRAIGAGTNLARSGLVRWGLSGAARMGGAALLGAGGTALAAGGAAIAGGVGLGMIADDVANNGLFKGSAADSTVDRLARLIPIFSDSIIRLQEGSKQGARQGVEARRGKILDEALPKVVELRKQQEEIELNLNRVAAERWRLQGDLNDSIRSQFDEEKRLSSIMEEISAMSSDALKEDENAQARKIDLINQEMSLRKSIAADHARTIEEQLQMEQRSLAAVEQRIAAEKESAMTAKERFGMMSEDQQQEIIDLRERLRSGEELDTEELGRLRGLSQGIDAEVQMQALSKAERGGFAQLGIEEESSRRVQRDEDLANFLRESIGGTENYLAQINLDAESVAKRLFAEVNAASEAKMKEVVTEYNKLQNSVSNIQSKITKITSDAFRKTNESPQ